MAWVVFAPVAPWNMRSLRPAREAILEIESCVFKDSKEKRKKGTNDDVGGISSKGYWT
jgi:hypothetical protein